MAKVVKFCEGDKRLQTASDEIDKIIVERLQNVSIITVIGLLEAIKIDWYNRLEEE